ncbi:MAG: sensor histidine kinase, partial [Candidatus Acidiferrales bacterium]
MSAKKWWRWDGRMRMLLTLELAIVLPAAALIGFSVWNLRSIYRDKAVEAAIQRDFNQFLAISEKRINEKLLKQVDEIRANFVSMESAPARRLDEILSEHPYIAHAYYYDPKNGFIFRSCPDSLKWDKGFREEAEYFRESVGSWIHTESKTYGKKLRAMAENDPHPYAAYDAWVHRGDRKLYEVTVLFLPLDLPEDRVALSGVIFDGDYLKNDFFPHALNQMTAEHMKESDTNSDHRPKVAIMIRPKGSDTKPLAASMGWDGGTAETERNFDSIFRGMTLGIKFTGTTVDAIAKNFLQTQFLILAGLSLLMAVGIWLTYRSVTREMALAKLKSDFVSNVSHELRTPLALVRLFAETLEMGRVSQDKHPEYFRIIRKESERLTALINNILDFSRIEAGRKEYDFRETNVTELVRETVDTYRYQIEEAGFTLELNLAQDVPPL